MAYVRYEAYSATASPATVYEELADLESYSRRTDAVRAVRIARDADGRKYSLWEVNFRSGVLRWSEFDLFDPVARRITFERRDGDPVRLGGEWCVVEEDVGATVTFVADFDMGMATFGDVLNPIAERAMRDNVGRILAGILGPEHEVTLRVPADPQAAAVAAA